MDLKNIFEKRRSVNFFDTKENINETLLEKIYNIARLVPSSFNLQPWKMLLVKNQEDKRKLRKAAFNQEKIEDASVVIVLLADMEGYKNTDKLLNDMIAKGYIKQEEKEKHSKMPETLYGNPFAGRGFALRNVGLFAMGFMLAAKDLGVDTHPMDGFEPEKVKEAFKIPDRYEVAMLIAVGYHDKSKNLLQRLNRKEYEEVVVRGSF
ncbi:MAG: nitroreductase family protein [Elusimicrobia bacterium]|nr:nitroreductase family protein [Elusimicrobiota bacterium]